MTREEIRECFYNIEKQALFKCRDSNAFNCEGDCNECESYAMDRKSYLIAKENILNAIDNEYPRPYEKLLFKTVDAYGYHWYIGEFFYDLDNKPSFCTTITEKHNGFNSIENYYSPREVIDWMYLEDCLKARE